MRPAANLADRMRGRIEYVNKKMKIIRSRSAERLRGVMRPHTTETEPVLGRARAVLTCLPNPCDKDALSFQAGDIIDILHMNPNGLWRGRCGDRVGQFKFVNVEMMPERNRSRCRSLRNRANKDRPIQNIYEVMRILDMPQYLPVLLLNGYEDLTLFKDLDDEELDYLGIHERKHRGNLIEMAALLFPPDDNKNKSDNESLHVADARL